MSDLGWSVIIPAFNEARRLPRYLDEVVGYFEGSQCGFKAFTAPARLRMGQRP